MPDLAQKWPPPELLTVVNQVASCALTYIFVTFSFLKKNDNFFSNTFYASW